MRFRWRSLWPGLWGVWRRAWKRVSKAIDTHVLEPVLTFAAVYRRKLLRTAAILLVVALVAGHFLHFVPPTSAGTWQHRAIAAFQAMLTEDGKSVQLALSQIPKNWHGFGEILDLAYEAAGVLFTIVKYVLGFFALLVFCVLLRREMAAEVVIFDPFTVPKKLEETGLTGEVLAHRVRDRLLAMKKEAATLNASAKLAAARDEGVSQELEIAGSKAGIKVVAAHLRELFGWHQRHVSGDLVMTPVAAGSGTSIRVTVYVTKGKDRSEPVPCEPLGEDMEQLIKRTATAVLREIDPILLGWYYYRQGDYEEAERTVEKALRDIALTRPGRARALTLFGAILDDKGNFRGAIEKYREALTADRRYAGAYYNWGVTLFAQKEYAQAIEKYARAAEIDPKNADTYFNWGVALFAQKEYAQAIEKYARAAEIDPKHAAAYCGWGAALSTLGKYAQAIEKYAIAAEMDPRNAAAYFNWGCALFEQKEYAQAIEKYARAAEIDPKDADTFFNWGLALKRLGRREEAQEKYGLAMELREGAATE